MNKMGQIKNTRGNIVSFIILYPFIILFIMYMVFAGSFFMQTNDMNIIVSKALDEALIGGRVTNEIFDSLGEALDRAGFDDPNREIIISNNLADPRITDDSSYVERGNTLGISVVNKRAHPFYYINKALHWDANQELFWIRASKVGMSERW